MARLILCVLFLLAPLTSAASDAIHLGAKAPPFALPDLLGRTISLDYFDGHPGVLVFWSAANPRSIELLYDFRDYQEKWVRNDLAIVAVNTAGGQSSASNLKAVRDYAESLQIIFPVLIDSGLVTLAAYGVEEFPTVVMIDAGGRVSAFLSGPLPALRDDLRAARVAGWSIPEAETAVLKFLEGYWRSNRIAPQEEQFLALFEELESVRVCYRESTSGIELRLLVHSAGVTAPPLSLCDTGCALISHKGGRTAAMARILCVGSAVLDLVFSVARHPAENEELRASSLRVTAGGNAANTARVLRALGHEVTLAAVLVDHPAGAPLEGCLRQAGVDLEPCRRVAGLPPLSAILLSQTNGRRTIVHYRDTPEYGLDDFARFDLSRWRWAHFEARPGSETERMVRHAHLFRPDLPISVEVEKVRPGIEACFPLARLVLFSRGYVEACGFSQPEMFLREMRARIPHTLLSAAWGEEGAWSIEADGTLHHAPAIPPPVIVDSIGAGDTFNAGMIGALAAGRSLRESLDSACRLAGRKIGQVGFSDL